MPSRNTLPNDLTPVSELWNLSKLTGSWLNDIGIYTYKDLARADLFEIWLKIRDRHHQATKLMYYALWGAVNNCHWNKIPVSEKAKLNGL